MTIRMSQSEASTFRRCRRKWFLGTYRGLQPREQRVTGALSMGTRIHACLESYYTDGRHPVEVHRELHYNLLEALKPDENTRCDGGVYNILRKIKRTANARPPFYERIEVRHNRQQLESYWNRFHGIVIDIMRVRAALDAGGDHRVHAYPTPTKDCSWDCDFAAVCPLLDDGSAAESMLESYFQPGNPYARYDDRDHGMVA
jgi:hypothetical protein